MKHSLNIWAVIVATVVAFIIGGIWFSVLREPYLAGLGKTQAELDLGPNLAESMIIQLVGNVVMAVVLAWIIGGLGKSTAGSGLRVGLLVWLGFVAAVMAPLYAFQAFSLQFFAINAGYPLLALAVMGAIVGRWRK
jgi:hypothetical protein